VGRWWIKTPLVDQDDGGGKTMWGECAVRRVLSVRCPEEIEPDSDFMDSYFSIT
jgi:hypothetical protein